MSLRKRFRRSRGETGSRLSQSHNPATADGQPQPGQPKERFRNRRVTSIGKARKRVKLAQF